jgi:HAD superfamily hydrolase (TIGR01509 family)
MEQRFAIFDMDGTLVDSMLYWHNLGQEYLESKGVTGDLNEVLERSKPMTMVESGALFIKEFGLAGTPESVAAEINAVMEGHYRNDVQLKAGAKEYLEQLRQKGIKLCVASATAEDLVSLCLTRLGVRDYFEFLLSCESVGTGKNRPDVYFAAAERLGAAVENTVVYEDAWYAVRTAKNAGFRVVAIFDYNSRARWDEIRAMADTPIESWAELLEA